MHISGTVAQTAATIDAILLPTVEKQARGLPKEASPAHCYFATRLARGELFLPNELAIATALLEGISLSNRVHEIRNGMLSLLLGSLGFEVVGIQPDRPWWAMNVELLQALAPAIPFAGTRCRFINEEFPLSSGRLETVGTLALATDPLFSFRDLGAYEWAVANVSMLGGTSANLEIDREAFAELRHLGYAAEPFVSSEGSTAFYLLRRQLRVETLKGPFARVGTNAWSVVLPEPFCQGGDSSPDQHQSDLWLLEDNFPLGPPHCPHSDIRDLGRGRYSHWGGSLNFSTSDNADPNQGGRSYRIARQYFSSAQTQGYPCKSDAIVNMLADILKQRNILEVAYFHTDHFEPWHGPTETDNWWRAIERFASLTGRLRFGGRLSLFYTPLLIHRRSRRWDWADHRAFGDAVVFRRRSPDFLSRCREFVRPLETQIGHEFHIHIHHEGWTRSDFVHPEIAGWMESRGTPAKDSRRFDFYLGLCRAILTEEIGRPFDRWAFVHGNWALNASDHRFCQITDELAILKRHGCYGDFTFPAGEARLDPSMIEFPFTCGTPSLCKSYDQPEAAPRPLSAGAGDLASGRFLVWNSVLKGGRSSLDLYAPQNLRLFLQPEFLLRDWLAQSVVIDNCLYIKTHAHSMHELYRLWEAGSDVPHSFPAVKRLFDLLEKVAERVKIPVVPVTVEEVASRLRAFDGGKRKESPMAVSKSSRSKMGVSGHVPTITAISNRLNGRHLYQAERLLFEVMPAFISNDDGYYSERMARKAVLESYEWAVLNYVCQNLDPHRVRLIEMGAGWGMLSILLAVLGFEGIAFTGDPMYAGVSAKLSARMDAALPHQQQRLRIVEGFFPDALNEVELADDREDVLISTNVIHGFTNRNQDRILAAAMRFHRVILDTGAFGIDRDEAARQQLRDWLIHGFEIDRSLWQDRLLLMTPKHRIGFTRSRQAADYSWLVGEPARLDGIEDGDLSRLHGSLQHLGAHSWHVRLPAHFRETGDSNTQPYQSCWRLLEDGALLGPAHALHSDIHNRGQGRYSHWGDQLYFSTSDNSNPTSNGRRYTLARALSF